MKYNYLIFLDYSTGEIIRIKLTEEQKRDSEKYDDFEEYLTVNSTDKNFIANNSELPEWFLLYSLSSVLDYFVENQ